MVETFEPRTNYRNREAMICPIYYLLVRAQAAQVHFTPGS